MERMKRLISAFLALVLVLGMVPGVPMAAGAEEVETQPEVLAVETTEAVTVPEETEAPETTAAAETQATEAPVVTEPAVTVPETTVPEETEEAETIPQETVPDETVPQETVTEETVPEQTVPEETVEETIPVETVEELESSAEAADAAVLNPVTGIEISANKKRTYVGDSVKLTAVVSPEGADESTISWVFEEGESIAEIRDNVLTANAPGKVKIHAVSVENEEIVSDPVEVVFVNCRIEINLKPVAEDNLMDTDGDEVMDTVCVKSGEAVAVSVKYQTTEDDENWVTEYLLEPSLGWSLSEGGELYASLTPSTEDPTEVTLKAKTVTEYKTVILTAKDEIAGTASVPVIIYTDPYKVEIRSEAGELVNEETIIVDLADEDEAREFMLSANVLPSVIPGEEPWNVSWESSSNMVASVKPVENEAPEEEQALALSEEDDGKYSPYALVTMGGLTGEATITATCKEDPSIKATVTIKAVRLLQQEDIDWTYNSEKVTELVAGDSVTLQAVDIRDSEDLVVLDSTVVKWELGEEDEPYAKLSENGKLTARDVPVGKDITVYCRVIDNEDEAYLVLPVTIRPEADNVSILDENGEVCNSQTLYVDTADGSVEPFTLGFEVGPVDDEPNMGAMQKVTWKSSNTKIATVDAATGEIKWKGQNGTVTITATAADGSGKKATVKVKFSVMVSEISINLSNKQFLRSGETVAMIPTIAPAAAKNVDLTWYLGEGDEAYAKISSTGKLTAKTIYQNRYITVYAEANDGSGQVAEKEVLIKPAKDNILTLVSDGEYVTKTTQILDVPSEETITLEAFLVGDFDAEDEVKWKYSSSVVREDVEENTPSHEATFRMKKTGTATITATSLTNGKTATVTLKGVRKTSEVDILEQEDGEEYVLASGKSLTLKAKTYDAEGKSLSKKVVWSFADSEHYKYAKISSSGKVTAYSGYYGEPVDITVVATASDNNEVTDECTVTICPIAQGIMIQMDSVAKTSYTHEVRTLDESALQLTAAVYPLNKARQDVNWKSSNKKIATVDENGEVTCVGTGTVTITATAKDGSGKKATFKLTIKKLAATVAFKNTNVVNDGDYSYMVLAGGKTLTIKTEVLAADGKKPTSSKLEWFIEDADTSCVKSFKDGVLKTKTVTEVMMVTVTARALDGSGAECRMPIYICPATTSVEIRANGNTVNEWYVREGETVQLSAIGYPYNDPTVAAQAWTWTSSSKSYATVDEYGVVTGLSAGKTGKKTVTITAKAKDGTGEKDTIKIIIYR